MMKQSLTIVLLSFIGMSHAKYGDITGESESSGYSGIIIFLMICAAGYLWHQHEEQARDERIAQREREEALREELRRLKKKIP